MLRHPLRVALRLAGFGMIVGACLLEYLLRLWLAGKAADPRQRAEWLTRWCRRTLRCLNVQVLYEGEPPAGGVLASNHLSYLDILVLSARSPTIFVAKSEIRRWPVFGWLTRAAGSVFINRERRMDVKRMADEFAPIIQRGLLLCLFPEGTSSNGHEVLRFHSSLFGPAEARQWPVTPVAIIYSLTDGSVENEVCYWGDMVLVPHLLNLFSKNQIKATVIYGVPLPPGLNRKELAHQLHERVSLVLQRYQGSALRSSASGKATGRQAS